MTKYLVALMTTILVAALPTYAQKGYDEGSAFVKPIFYFNNIDIKYNSGNTGDFRTQSTISNSLNVLYSRITKHKLILSSGLGVGERYYYLNSVKGEVANTRVFYLNWDLNVGYRYADKDKLKQEIRVGNLINTALGEYQIYSTRYYARGSLGRNTNGNGTTMIQYLQWNAHIRNKLILGLQVERKLFDSKLEINYVEYTLNRNGIDIYNSSQTGVALIVGLVF